MTVKYVDAHCHIQFDQYAKDDAELIERMEKNGIAGIMVGVDLESSKKAVAIAEKYEHLFAAIGVHPNRESEESFDAAQYRELAASSKVVAVGECGLDYFRPAEMNEEVKRKQKRLLQDHIQLAAELNKPLIIHARPSKGTQDAYQDLITMLEKARHAYPNLRGDVHFFVGGENEARELIALGFTVSYTAVITFARDYDETIRRLPLSHILSETDAPYVAPRDRRGTRNDPLSVIDVVEMLATIRREDTEDVRKTLAANAVNLFSLPLQVV